MNGHACEADPHSVCAACAAMTPEAWQARQEHRRYLAARNRADEARETQQAENYCRMAGICTGE